MFFTDNVPSIELFEGGIMALKNELLWYFDNPIRVPKPENITDGIFEERWKTLCEMLQTRRLSSLRFDTKSIVSKLIARFDRGSWSHVGASSGQGKMTDPMAKARTGQTA